MCSHIFSVIFASLQTWTKTPGAWKKYHLQNIWQEFCILKKKKNIKKNVYFFYIFIYLFKAIQTALFYKKNMLEMCKSYFNMILDIPGFCGQNKNQSFKKNWLSDCSLIFLKEWLVLPVGSFEVFNQIHILVLFKENTLTTSDSKN